MPAFLAGLAALVLLALGAWALAMTEPQKLAIVLRKTGGVVLVAVAALLMARGAVPLAIPLGVLGLALLGLPVARWFGIGGPFGGSSQKSPGQTSEVRTEGLAMELDHDTGSMEGSCLKGDFAGRTLSSLSDDELLLLLEELRVNDAQGALLLEAYLDRRRQGWRDGRADEAARETPRAGGQGRMSAKEAYDVLGLWPGASDEDISAAHRKLMMKLHPDQGGSTYLAARINEAKDLLLGRK
ncbi:MAG: molecular chaperone DnaJ [Hyphomicrobiales bacterium]|nr:MAG: molecular chaperone DnaJ [Hyphomicrobiales bacterium]